MNADGLRSGFRVRGCVMVLHLITLASLAPGCGDLFEKRAAAQGYDARGVVEVGSDPRGAWVLVTIDIPVDGKADGLTEHTFVLLDASEVPNRLRGRGEARMTDKPGSRGKNGDALHVLLDGGQQLLFIREGAPVDVKNVAPSKVRTIQVSDIVRMLVAPVDRLLPLGTPGTGRSSHAQKEKLLSDRFKARAP